MRLDELEWHRTHFGCACNITNWCTIIERGGVYYINAHNPNHPSDYRDPPYGRYPDLDVAAAQCILYHIFGYPGGNDALG